MENAKYYAISADGGNSWTKQDHTLDDLYCYLTDDIACVAYFSQDTGRCHIAYVGDHKAKDGNHSHLYKGRFGNCIIALQAKRTNTLHLLDEVKARRMVLQQGSTLQDKKKALSENCKIMIQRATTFSHSPLR